MNTEFAIKINHISKRYNLYEKPQDRFKEAIGLRNHKLHRDFLALKDIDFDVKKGETVGIVGTNGSGKSTLLKLITGVLKPTSGSVEVCGKISALLELGAGFNQEYTGMENIYLNGRMMGYSKKAMQERANAIIEFAEIGEFINQPVKNYSSGMFARLAFAVAINVEPDILIVDEALSVGDLFFQNKCFKKFDELKKKGVTILFVSHDISSVRQMCSRVIWIEKGNQIIFDQSDKVCDMYMDHKRIGMNNILDRDKNIDIDNIKAINDSTKKSFPKLVTGDGELISDKFKVLSAFFTDETKRQVTHLIVDETYEFHAVVEFYQNMKNIILGFSLENNKGLPLFDINNYINQQQGILGKHDELTEVVYKFKLPRLMKGIYILNIGIAEGTQEQHQMHTWLHGVDNIEIVNNGYNSSYIEIPAVIEVRQLNKDFIDILE